MVNLRDLIRLQDISLIFIHHMGYNVAIEI